MLPTSTTARLFIDHIVLTIGDINRSAEFYSKIFGEPAYRNEGSVMYMIGPTRLFLILPRVPALPNDTFNPKRIGLEHFAIGITTIEDLKEIEKALDKGSIKHSGIHIDNHSGKEKIWLDDPDKIRVEFFM
jgi:glyoxylase I family protein